MDKVFSEIQRDIIRSKELSEQFEQLEDLSDIIMRRILADMVVEDKKKNVIISARITWEQVKVRLGQGGNDVAAIDEKRVTLESLKLVFFSAQIFYMTTSQTLEGVEANLIAL